MKIAMFIVMFLLIGAFFIISQNDLKLIEKENLDKFTSLYTQWLGSVGENSIQTAGYAVKLEWLPGEKG